MKQYPALFFVGFVCFVVGPAWAGLPASVADAKAAFGKVDALFAAWDRVDSPGAAVGVIYDGEILYKRGYGSANLDYQVPLDSSSVFYIASTSKQFAAASIALLAVDGKLSLDDDIREYVPEMPDFGTPITVRHLVHHTSGLRDYLTLMNIAGWSFENYFNQETALAISSRQKALNFEPGSEFLYSNTGYKLIAIIVERVSGKSLREFGEECFFEPLGMDDTFWDDDHNAVVRNRVVSYRGSAEAGFEQYVKNFDVVGSGGLMTTIDDLAKWDANFYEPKVGGQALIDLMLTRGTLNDGTVLPYAFGLGHGEHNGRANVSHGGGMLGFRTEFVRFPAEKFSVIVLCNLASMDASALAMRVADVFLGEGDAAVQGEEEAAPALVLSEAELRAKRGDFYNDETGELLKVSVWRETLRLVRNGAPLDMLALSPTLFASREGNIRIEFDAAGDGSPTRFDATIGGEKRAFRAVARPALSEDALEPYVGEYYSAELDVPFRIATDGRRLELLRPGQPAMGLQPVIADRFQGDFGVAFERDGDGAVTGFRVHAGRVRNLWFERQQ